MSSAFTLHPVSSFRLDLTVAALQRVSSNPVDGWVDGRWLRAFSSGEGVSVLEVSQRGDRSLAVRVTGPATAATARAIVRRMLGADIDLEPFRRAAKRVPGVAQLAQRFRGLAPPRFASLWETLLGAIPFQQLSLASGMAVLKRIVERCSPEVSHGGLSLRPTPPPEAVASLPVRSLRALGLSEAKARALRGAAQAVISSAVREETLERMPTEEAVRALTELPGIGPWTAQLVLLRGLRRLDVFPPGDAGALRRMREALGVDDPADILGRLGPWRGMLYYLLLLSSKAPPKPLAGTGR